MKTCFAGYSSPVSMASKITRKEVFFERQDDMTQDVPPSQSQSLPAVSIWRRVLRVVLYIFILIAVVGVATFGYFYFTSKSFRGAASVIITRSDTPEKAFPGCNEINLLVMGRDLDRDPSGKVLKTRGRTDAMMLAHINFRKKTVNILSIPRDTLVCVPGYKGKRRINSANSLGGPELAQAAVEKLVGVKPDYYVLINFEGFEKAIDALGGMKIEVDKEMDYDDNWGNLHIHLEPGRQVLNGKQAMGFVRFRYSNDGKGESDLVRIERQQKFLHALKAELRNPITLLKVPFILDNISQEMEGNMTTTQMICLSRFFKSVPSQTGVEMVTLPAQDIDSPYVHPDIEATRVLVERMFFAQ